MPETRMPFGKYEDWRLCDVPTDYLVWLASEPWVRPYLKINLAAELHRRGCGGYVAPVRAVEGFQVADVALFADLVERGYKALARQLHPDAGAGADPERMVALNRMVEDLRAQIEVARKRLQLEEREQL